MSPKIRGDDLKALLDKVEWGDTDPFNDLELSGEFREEGEDAQEMALLVLIEEQKKIRAKIEADRQELTDQIRADLIESQRKVEQLVRQITVTAKPVAPQESPNLRMILDTTRSLFIWGGALFFFLFLVSAALSVGMAVSGYGLPK